MYKFTDGEVFMRTLGDAYATVAYLKGLVAGGIKVDPAVIYQANSVIAYLESKQSDVIATTDDTIPKIF